MKHCIAGREQNINNMIKHIIESKIEGDVLDIGVYEGYSSVLAMNMLVFLGNTSRKFYLYDTFEGMPEPTIEDGDRINHLYEKQKDGAAPGETGWVKCSLEKVKMHVNENTTYPKNNIVYVKGMVEDTLPTNTHQKIAYMRLDTDFYSSTKAELEYLYDKLEIGGVVIVDDYASKFAGCTKAVDEFFLSRGIEKNQFNLLSPCGMYFIKN
jgi:hypothetical protein